VCVMQLKVYLGLLVCISGGMAQPVEVENMKKEMEKIVVTEIAGVVEENSEKEFKESVDKEDEIKEIIEKEDEIKENVDKGEETEEDTEGIFEVLDESRIKLKDQIEKVTDELDDFLADNNATQTTISVVKPIQSILGLFGGLIGTVAKSVGAVLQETVNIAEQVTDSEEFDNVTRSVGDLVSESAGLLQRVVQIKLNTGKEVMASIKHHMKMNSTPAKLEEDEAIIEKEATEEIKPVDENEETAENVVGDGIDARELRV